MFSRGNSVLEGILEELIFEGCSGGLKFLEGVLEVFTSLDNPFLLDFFVY